MISRIITGGERERYSTTWCELRSISPYDQHWIVPEKTTITIDQVRALRKQASLTPYNSPRQVFILTTEQITIEAQSALLKLLEEPTPSTDMMILATNPYHLLPTILSRCQLITTPSPFPPLPPLLPEIIQTLRQPTITTALSLAQRLAKEPDLTNLLAHCIIHMREQVITNDYSLADPLKQLIATQTLLATTSVNQRMALEILFLPKLV